jgi:hypothetical protein
VVVLFAYRATQSFKNDPIKQPATAAALALVLYLQLRAHCSLAACGMVCCFLTAAVATGTVLFRFIASHLKKRNQN